LLDVARARATRARHARARATRLIPRTYFLDTFFQHAAAPREVRPRKWWETIRAESPRIFGRGLTRYHFWSMGW
jgi:hypothetical protein